MVVPDRWMEYRPMGKVIPGTRFIAFKVPLKEALCSNLRKDDWFTPQHIIKGKPNIALIVDLTNTTRYYNKDEFKNANKSYVKIFCPGHVVPTKDTVSQFFDSVDTFLSQHPDDGTLIGVHCTHGVNRTGYFICKYMIDKMGRDPILAIEDVGRARGYPIERKNYLEDLKGEGVMVSPPTEKGGLHTRQSERGMRPAREVGRGWRPTREIERSGQPARTIQRERPYYDRNSYDRDLPMWWRGDNRDGPFVEGPRFGQLGRGAIERATGYQGRSQNYSDRSEPYRSKPYRSEPRPSREYSSGRYNQTQRSTYSGDRSDHYYS